jgi:hypothetical protein
MESIVSSISLQQVQRLRIRDKPSWKQLKSSVLSESPTNILTNVIFRNEVNFVKKIIKDTNFDINKSNDNLCVSESLLQAPSALKILSKKSDWLYMFIQNKISQTNNNLYNIFLESKIDMKSNIGQELFTLTTKNNSRPEFIYIIVLLLKLGADVNQIINNNDTLLHISAQSGNINFCIILIKKGADINIKNLQNKTPLDVIGGLFDNYSFRLSTIEKETYQHLLRNTYIRENNWKRRKNFMQFISFMERNNYKLEKIFQIYDILRYITSFI